MAPSRAPPDDDDPVEKEYDVFITPPLDASARLYLLQHPNRDRDKSYNAETNTAPLQIRLKPKTGFLELDVPILPDASYSVPRASAWGAALDHTKLDGGFGIAAGLAGQQPPRSQGRAARRAAQDAHEPAVPPPMAHQTLGGQILSRERGTPTYMIGAFQGERMHLTPLTGLVQMRPQFHHLDAQIVAERQSRARGGAVADGVGGRRGEGVPGQGATRAVLATTKATTNDNEDASATNTKQLLEQAQAEGWAKLKYHDEEEGEAYDAYHGRLFLQKVEEESRVRQLVSTMSNEDYLDAISAPRNDPHGKVRAAKQARAGKKAKEAIDVSDDSEDSDGDRNDDRDVAMEDGDEGDVPAASAASAA